MIDCRRRTRSMIATLALFAAPGAAWAAGAPVATATDAQKQDAQTHFEAGMKAHDAGDKDKALAEYQASYDAVASPNSHLLVARTLAELGRSAEAYAAYDQTAAEAQQAAQADPKYKNAADAATTERDALRAKIALLQITVTGAGPGDTLEVGGRSVEQADWSKPVPVMPGSVQVVLHTQAGANVAKSVDATAGGSPTLEISAAPPAPAPAPAHADAAVTTQGMDKRTLAYIAGGVGVAGIATFAIFGAMNNAKYSDLQSACTNNACPPDKQSEADTGRTYQTVANVGLVVGVIGVGSGVALYLLDRHERKEQSARRTPQIYVGPRSVVVRGSF